MLTSSVLLAKAKQAFQYFDGVLIEYGLIILVHQCLEAFILAYILQVLVPPDLQHATSSCETGAGFDKWWMSVVDLQGDASAHACVQRRS